MTSLVIVVSAVFRSVMRIDTQTHSHTRRQTPMNVLFTYATLVGVSKNSIGKFESL